MYYQPKEINERTGNDGKMEKRVRITKFLLKLSFLICSIIIILCGLFDHSLAIITNIVWGVTVLHFIYKDINQID